MNEQTHAGLWIRWAPETWEKDGSWATSIQKNTLNNGAVTEAQFILQDARCIFLPISELRRVLANKKANERGTIVFRVNPESRTIDEKTASMSVIVSRTHKKVKTKRMIEVY
jgi:hypothetical protein